MVCTVIESGFLSSSSCDLGRPSLSPIAKHVLFALFQDRYLKTPLPCSMEIAARSFQLSRRGLNSRFCSSFVRRAAPSTGVLWAYSPRSSITHDHSLRPQTPLSPRSLPAPRFFSTMTTLQPQFAEGADTKESRAELDAVLQRGWTLDEEGAGIKKTFYFKSYFKAVVGVLSGYSILKGMEKLSRLQSFVNVVASQSTSKKHHATMTVVSGIRSSLTHASFWRKRICSG